MKVLINAYAVCPGMGSEPGMGWHWTTGIARHCEVYVITESEFREKIEEAVSRLPQRANIHFFWNETTPEVRKMCWNQGDWRFYWYYEKWQKRTYHMAKEIYRKEKIDILHQLNMIGFREPGYLWKLSQETGIPFVWGPTDAKEGFPKAYLTGLTVKHRMFMTLKSFISKMQLKYNRRVDMAARTAATLLAASREGVESMRKYKGLEAVLMNETGCETEDGMTEKNVRKGVLNILWCGKLDVRKQLSLAIRTMKELKASETEAMLHVVGGGDNAMYVSLAKECGVEEEITWHGMVNHEEVQQLMRRCDIMLFTSLAEGTPAVVLEAIANSLPVVCHDCCGMATAITDEVGRKIPLSDPTGSVSDFARVIKSLAEDRVTLEELSRNCGERRKQLSWEKKAEEMVAIYRKARKKCIR